MRLDTALDGYWLARRRDFSPHTVNDYERSFRRLCDFLGPDKEFDSITARDIHRFLNHVQQQHQLGAKTLANIWTALSSLWSWAEQEIGADHIIRRHVPLPKFRRRQIETYSEDDIRRLLEACEYNAEWTSRRGKLVKTRRPSADRDRAIVLVFLDTGIRCSECSQLRLADYDQNRGEITIWHGKGNKKRVVYMGQRARQALWRYLSGRSDLQPNSPLFTTTRGKPIHRSSLTHLVQHIGERAGVHSFPHKFRHTFAITFLRNGGDLLTLQAILGHEKLETVRLYAQIAAVDIERAQRTASPADNWKL